MAENGELHTMFSHQIIRYGIILHGFLLPEEAV